MHEYVGSYACKLTLLLYGGYLNIHTIRYTLLFVVVTWEVKNC